jgi:hypothetical protein
MRRRLPLILFVLTAGLVSGVAVSSAADGSLQITHPSDFGGVPVGQTSGTQHVQITNTSATPMTITLSKGSGGDPGAFLISGDSCGNVLSQNDSCSFDVAFAPDVAGALSATIDVTSDTASASDTVQVSGTGQASQVQAPGSVDLGNVKVGTTSSGTSVLVTNNGNGPLSVTGATATDNTTGAGFNVASNGCSNPVAQGNTCTITVSASPTVTGALSGVLSILSNDPASLTAVSLTATGTVPQASVDASVSFATPRNVPLSQHVTLTNTGNAVLDVDHATLTGDATFTDLGTGTCGGAQLQPGGSCFAEISFLPTTAGTSNATVTFIDDSGSMLGSKQVVKLLGNAVLPNIQATPTSVSFPDVALGRVTGVTHVIITNITHAPPAANLTISGLHLAGNARSFVLGAQTCIGATIVPGGTCRVNVRFAPRKLGGRLATLVVANDAGPNLSVGLGGNGVAPADASNLRAATGCESARLTWRAPDAAGFRNVVLVRNARRYPRNPDDGVSVKHRAGLANDTKPRQFHTYRYTLFAIYRSYNHSHSYRSPGLRIKVHLGRICQPGDGGSIRDLTPKVDWTKYTGTRSYAFILQRGSSTLLVRYPHKSFYQFARTWTYHHARHSLARGGTYNFYLYAYTRTHRNGVIIGHTTWTER